MSKKQRDFLEKYAKAVKELELAEACIKILEGMHAPHAERCIAIMKQGQQVSLKKLDTASLQLGIPNAHSIVRRCFCGKIKGVELLSQGFNQDGREVWFCDRCIPL